MDDEKVDERGEGLRLEEGGEERLRVWRLLAQERVLVEVLHELALRGPCGVRHARLRAALQSARRALRLNHEALVVVQQPQEVAEEHLRVGIQYSTYPYSCVLILLYARVEVLHSRNENEAAVLFRIAVDKVSYCKSINILRLAEQLAPRG